MLKHLGRCCAASIIATGACELSAATLHVDGRSPGPADGSALAPFSTIGDALALAVDGDTVKVAAGTYPPIAVHGKSISLLGGFKGATTDAYATGAAGDFETRDRDAYLTRIAGAGSGVVVLLDVAGDTLLEGFYVSGGVQGVVSDGSPYEGQHPHVRDNVIEDNGAGELAEGGGVWSKTRLTLQGNVIRRNTAARGAGLYCYCPEVNVDGNVIEDNIGVGDHGGGLYLASSHIDVGHNLVRGNITGPTGEYGVGGGVIIVGEGTVARLHDNVWTGNSAPKRGSAIFIDDGADVTLVHELVHANACGYAGGSAIAVDGADAALHSRASLENVTVASHPCDGAGNGVQVENSDVVVSDSIFWDNGDDFSTKGDATLSVRYTLSFELIDGTGNLQGDPLFADAAAGDYHVRSTRGRLDASGSWVLDTADSPSIDAGDPATDFAEEPDPNGGRVDLGVYGNSADASKSLAGDGPIDPPPSTSTGPTPADPSAVPGATDGSCSCDMPGGGTRRPLWLLGALALVVWRRPARSCDRRPQRAQASRTLRTTTACGSDLPM